MAEIDRLSVFDTGEVHLAYREQDGIPPAVVYLHPLSGSSEGDLFEVAPGDHHAFAYDARGHGHSSRTPGIYAFSDYGRDSIAFLRGVVKAPALLIGHSLGAMTSLYAAAHCPEFVRAVFLADPPLYASEAGLRDERALFQSIHSGAEKPERELLEQGWPPVRARALSLLDPGIMAMALDETMLDGWNTDELLKQISCPVWLQYGDRDRGSQIYDGELERATGLIRDCTVVHIAGTGHAGWIPERDKFFGVVREFIEATSY